MWHTDSINNEIRARNCDSWQIVTGNHEVDYKITCHYKFRRFQCFVQSERFIKRTLYTYSKQQTQTTPLKYVTVAVTGRLSDSLNQTLVWGNEIPDEQKSVKEISYQETLFKLQNHWSGNSCEGPGSPQIRDPNSTWLDGCLILNSNLEFDTKRNRWRKWDEQLFQRNTP